MTIYFTEEMKSILREINPYLETASRFKEDTPEHIFALFEKLKQLVDEQMNKQIEWMLNA